jgi:hypothetical protein
VTSSGVPAGGPTTPVLKVDKTAGAQCYAGTTPSVGYLASVGAIPFSASATVITVQMYVPNAGVDVKLKTEDATNSAVSVETDVIANTVGWQTLTFDFSKQAPGTAALDLTKTYDKISIFPDFTCSNGAPPPSADEIAYVGPLVFLGAAGPAAPPLSAPSLPVPATIAAAPTLPAGNVISLFSSAYTNVPVDTWSTGWSGCCNTLVDPYVISGHNVKQYTLHHFAGIEFGLNGTNAPIDATAMTFFHVDVWSPNPPAKFEVQLVNGAGGATPLVTKYDVSLATGTWVGLDIPLASFSPAVSPRNQLNQMLLVTLDATGAPSSGVVYVDNVYFHK